MPGRINWADFEQNISTNTFRYATTSSQAVYVGPNTPVQYYGCARCLHYHRTRNRCDMPEAAPMPEPAEEYRPSFWDAYNAQSAQQAAQRRRRGRNVERDEPARPRRRPSISDAIARAAEEERRVRQTRWERDLAEMAPATTPIDSGTMARHLEQFERDIARAVMAPNPFLEAARTAPAMPTPPSTSAPAPTRAVRTERRPSSIFWDDINYNPF